MSKSLQAAIIVIAIAVASFAISYAGILGTIALSTQLQLLLQVVGVSIVVLGLSFLGITKLNRDIDQADKP